MVKRTKYLLFIQEKTLLLVEPFIWGNVRFHSDFERWNWNELQSRFWFKDFSSIKKRGLDYFRLVCMDDMTNNSIQNVRTLFICPMCIIPQLYWPKRSDKNVNSYVFLRIFILSQEGWTLIRQILETQVPLKFFLAWRISMFLRRLYTITPVY